MARYKEAKLQLMLELAEFDYNLLLLAATVGSKTFGMLLNTFQGCTISFPSSKDVKKIGRKIGRYRKTFKDIVKKQGRGTKMGHLAQIGLMIDHPDVRKATKAKLTMAIFQEYIKSLLEDDTFQLTLEDIEKVDTSDKIRLYELHVNELAQRANVFNAMTALRK